MFGVSIDYLVGRTGVRQVATLQQSPLPKTITVPILGRIKAGIPILSEENWEGEVEVPADVKADFALRISGDSMSWAGIAESDIAVLKQVTTPAHGSVVAAVIEEGTWETTLKFWLKENGQAVLKAANPEYKDIPVGPKLKVIGQLVTIMKKPPSFNDYLAHLMHKDVADRKWQLAIEVAQQHGLNGENVANLIGLFGQTIKHVR